ncbi:hypothetical protein FSP39_024387 [Pinctada imbricata]|uniref:Heat shock 70 kDa protein 12A n=1 Tax=Pinctada imbricata TaxID=66713 RepID=A0AA88YJN0_PINIB|nr:hypothetical protein FSP39_024387 [Pinctada imbricata]
MTQSVYKSVQKGRVLVAAIDFGTTYSGYAFSFRTDFENDPTKIYANTTWESGSLQSLKTPTCVLLKSDKTFHSFGYDAENKYSELANDELHEDWYFFRRFKMLLHGEKLLNRTVLIQDESGKKSLPARTVFAHGIRFLKSCLLKELKTRGLDEILKEDEEIHWVLTVPAIWNDSAKQFMREAAEEAGILMHNLSLALEPEAAALYCKVLPMERLEQGSSSNLSAFKPGMRYMILDLGGGTVDVTVQEVLEDNNLRELHKASGGAWGGTYVDSAFLQVIIKLVGNPVIQKFKTSCMADDLELTREFEIKKRTAGTQQNQKTTFKVPVALSEIFEEEYDGETLKESVQQSRYSGMLSWIGDKLRVNQSIVQEFFKHSFESIVEHIETLLNLKQCKGVDTLIMVGGYSECKMLQDTIKQTFSSKRVIIPMEAGLAVVKGAVLFGHNPNVIVSRMTKFSYGVESTRDFEEGDSNDKRFIKYGRAKCKDSFSKHVTLNTSVPVGDPLEPQYYRPLDKDQTEVVVPIFISTKENPRYTTDADCQYLGKVEIKLSETPDSDEEKDIEVKMTFGGTELYVEAKEVHSNKPCTAKFDFLSHHGD